MRGVFQGWVDPQDHLDTQGPWESQAAMVPLVKMEREAYQGTMGSQGKRVNQGLQARGVLQVREVDRAPPVVEVTTPRTHSQLLAQSDPGERGVTQAQRAPLGSRDLQGHQEMML